MPGNAHERMIELLDEAGQTYFKAMKTGLKLQEDASTWWSDQLKSVNGSAEWLNKPREVMTEAINQWQKNAETTLELMEKSTQESLELLNKAFAVGQADSIEAAQQKLNELWESSLNTMRENVQTTLKANAKFAEMWMEMASKQADDASQAVQ